jgi:sugar phosphate isomerase/epimerase
MERNRWTDRQPSFLVSEWLDRIAEAGFDGLELWDNHALLADEAELARLKASPAPMAVFNSYAGTTDAEADERAAATRAVHDLGATGMKYNVNRGAERSDEHIRNIVAWRRELPDSFRMLCECHGGTFMNDLPVAAEVFRDFKDEGMEVIIHPFIREADFIERWFDHLGTWITHAHVQMTARSGEGTPEADEAHIRDCVRRLREKGFNGSWTIEFTANTKPFKDRYSDPPEDIERSFQCACDDLRLLREILAG